MHLHTQDPDGLLRAMLAKHTPALALIQGYLDWAVPEAFSRCMDVRKQPELVPGAALGTNVRDLFLHRSDNEVMRSASLTVVERPNLGIRLSDGAMHSVRLRKWPRSWETSELLDVSIDDHLFGLDLSSAALEYVVLWDADATLMALKHCVLALVSHLDETSKTRIYAVADMPVLSGLLTGSGRSTMAPRADEASAAAAAEDFTDLLGKQEKSTGGGDDPA